MARKKVLTKAEQIVAYEHSAQAVRLEAESHAVQVTCLIDEKPVKWCSGVAVAVGRRRFIFTAAHDIRLFGPNEIWLLPRAGGNVRDRVTPLQVYTVGGEPGIRSDAGIIEIHPDDVGRLAYSFLPASRIANDDLPAVGDLIALIGFPDQHRIEVPRGPDSGDIFWTPATILTVFDDPATWAPEIDPGTEIYIDYPKEYSELDGDGKVPLPDVPAMSGGALWAVNITDQEVVWSASCMTLLGTIESWEPVARWANAVRVAQHRKLTRQWYPDLEILGLI